MYEEKINELKSRNLSNSVFKLALKYIEKGCDVDLAIAKAEQELLENQKELRKQRKRFY